MTYKTRRLGEVTPEPSPLVATVGLNPFINAKIALRDRGVTWTASNDSSFLDGFREADSIRSAVIAARHYLRNELHGEGKITYYVDGEPVRQDERSIFTNHKWEVTYL